MTLDGDADFPRAIATLFRNSSRERILRIRLNCFNETYLKREAGDIDSRNLPAQPSACPLTLYDNGRQHWIDVSRTHMATLSRDKNYKSRFFSQIRLE